MKNLDDVGCYALINAIVKQAVRDWRSAKKRLLRHPDSVTQRITLEDCERFFLSTTFGLLTDTDGRAFLDKLEEEWQMGLRRLKVEAQIRATMMDKSGDMEGVQINAELVRR